MKVQPGPERPVDRAMHAFSQSRYNQLPAVTQWIVFPLLMFSALALIWSIPFPHLDFLGRYNGFVNWASFVIAALIYYYYRLSPVLSYGMLLLVFAVSALIVGLEKLEQHNGLPVWIIAGTTLVFCLSRVVTVRQPEGTDIAGNFRLLILAPGWLLYKVGRRAGIRF